MKPEVTNHKTVEAKTTVTSWEDTVCGFVKCGDYESAIDLLEERLEESEDWEDDDMDDPDQDDEDADSPEGDDPDESDWDDDQDDSDFDEEDE